MNDADIIAALTPIFRRIFSAPDLRVTRDLNASQVERWDSLNHMALIIELEKLIGKRFTVDELSRMANTGDIIDAIRAKGMTKR